MKGFLKIGLISILTATFLSTAFADKLIIEPDQGRRAIISYIDKAKESIDITLYSISEVRLINTLMNAQRAGKKVRVLLEQHPYKNEHENDNAVARFTAVGIPTQFASSLYRLTHQKSIVFDKNQALVMTLNFTKRAFTEERNFAIVIDNPNLVSEIGSVYEADWAGKAAIVKEKDLIWSPNNAREKLTQLINNAKTSIYVYAESVTDDGIIEALSRAREKNVDVRVLTDAEDMPPEQIDKLENAGIPVRCCRTLHIHAKALIIDHEITEIGSINFTKPSIDENRELSVISSDINVTREMEETFNYDWDNAKQPTVIELM